MAVRFSVRYGFYEVKAATKRKGKEFPELFQVHERADLSRVAIHLFGDDKFVFTVEELRSALGNISHEGHEQCFIRVMQLHLPGVQERQLQKHVAREKGCKQAAISIAVCFMTRRLREELMPLRMKALKAQAESGHPGDQQI